MVKIEKKEEEVRNPDMEEPEDNTSLLGLFSKWINEKLKQGKEKRFAEVE